MTTPGTGSTPHASQRDAMRSSDRRVLIIGLVTMVVLLAIGVTGAALFTGSACADIQPDPAEAGVGDASWRPVVEDLLVGEDPGFLDNLAFGVADLEQELGPVSGAVDVSGARSLSPLAGGGIVAGGDRTSVIAPGGAAVDAAASFAPPAVVAGSGDALYSLALVNELTGQVDAIVPLDRDLDPDTCLDTAVVGEPLAFHLDAGDGQLLLFRVEEDSAGPELELRHAADGRAWTAALQVPVSPPGILAERVAARLGEDVVVSARRVIPGEAEPAVAAYERADGSPRWEVVAETVVERFGDGDPVWLEVLAVEDGAAMIAVSPDTEDRAVAGVLFLDTGDGEILWFLELDARARAVADAAIGAEVVAIALDAGGQTRLLSVARGDGRVVEAFEPILGGAGALTVRDDGSFVLVTGDVTTGLLSADGRGLRRTATSVRAHDVVADDGVSTLLYELPGGGAVAITFGG